MCGFGRDRCCIANKCEELKVVSTINFVKKNRKRRIFGNRVK